MGSQAPTSSSDRSRTYWTPPMERYFIDLMLDQVYKGNRAGHTFNKQAWTDMLETFNAKFGSKYDKDVLKGRYKSLWEQYNDVKTLLERSGFAWDEARQMVTASDYEWEAYIKTRPDVRSYKTKPVLNYTDLCAIFGYTTADGRYSFSSHDVDFDTDALGMKIGDGLASQLQTNGDRSRTNWTPTMDRFFVDLMLDQVNKGNKIDYSFNKQAWSEMISLFNEKFGSEHNKNVLRSRYKILRKHYSDMKIILRQTGFSLDESRQMVVADEAVWDAYVKMHPNLRSCKTTIVPDFNDLCMIYGNEIANGRKVRPILDADLHDEIHQMQIEGKGKQTSTTSCDRSRTYWTPPMDRYLIDLMLDQVQKGNKIESNFIAHAWTEMTSSFNVKFGSQHDKEVLKNRYKSLRKQHNDIKALLDQNGFSWDETRQMVKANDDSWDAYIKEHPDARSYRIKIVPNYNDMRIICGSVAANGRCSSLEHFIDDENDVLSGRIGDEIGNQDHSRYSIDTYWTEEMELYLLHLLLEEMHRRHRIDHPLTKDAWDTITMLFSEKFGCQYEDGTLRNQYKILWKKYNNIQILLGQDGFSWDESQKMIVAEDHVWDSFIQAYPDVQFYRYAHMPSYSNLCMIFGNSAADGINMHFHDCADPNEDVPGITVGEGTNSHSLNVCDGSRTYWTPPMDRYFIDLMLDQVHKGNKVDNTFTKKAWMEMVASFNAKFGSQHDKDVLRSRYKNLRKQYNDIKTLLDQNMFVWDETRQMVTANDDVWDAYLKGHPDARSYRTKTVTDYNSLKIIYRDETANGKNSDSSDMILKGNDVNNSDRSRTYWTPPMDQYFIELMVEQVHNGNKIDQSFNKQAWAHMITLFNTKFGCQHDKDVLKSRHKNLRKLYINVKVILSQGGFSWDETRQMVVADDDIWDAYIKVNPDAESYRTKILANYESLCVIYGNGIANGRQSPSDQDVDIEFVSSQKKDSEFCMKNNEVVGNLKPSATDDIQRNQDNSVLIPNSDTESFMSSRQRKRQFGMIATSQSARKVQKKANGGVEDAVSEMAGVVSYLVSKKNETDSILIENVMGALQAIPDIDEDLILDACDLLEDEKKAKTFLALDAPLRKKWLLRKLRS